MLALALVAGLVSTGVLAPSARGSVSSTSPALIKKLAKAAYIWGVAPEFVYRFARYNELITAPVNTFGGGIAAAWNNAGTNAGDASVLYLNAMLNLTGQGSGRGKGLVLTVPPSQSKYFVVDLLDGYINTVGSIGTRTTSSKSAQTYLLVGPTSPYAHDRTVRIHGFTYRVFCFDTNRGWMLIRARADTLVPASDPTSSASILKNVVERFGLSTLAQFEASGHKPKYFQPGQYTPTQEQLNRAKKWHTAPTNAVAFFDQVGQAVKRNPLPTATTGLNGVPLRTLPSWVVPQANARVFFRNPSYGQKRALALFRPIGLTANGFRVHNDWGAAQLRALQQGYEAGSDYIHGKAASVGATKDTNYWGYRNQGIGTYPNTIQGYQIRAVLVIYGGANIPEDAVYAQATNLNGQSTTDFVGNNTYKLTFKPPVINPPKLPVVGTVPPTANDAQGNPLGFWSVTAYQPDASQSAAPFIPQSTVLNTAYSSANVAVTGVDPSTDTLTVQPSAWTPLEQSTPIMFGPTAAQYGLKPGVPYYVASTPTQQTNPTTYSFKVSAIWKQQLSAGSPPVPIQGNTGMPGPIAALTNPGGAVNLQWGPIQPVSQLGSQQMTSGKLVKNANGSVTIWFGPKLPKGAPAANWIPTPSSAYYQGIYGQTVSTKMVLIMRIYYPAPGSDTQASILPPPNGSMTSTYEFPAVHKVTNQGQQ
jgi:hypothetical protein